MLVLHTYAGVIPTDGARTEARDGRKLHMFAYTLAVSAGLMQTLIPSEKRYFSRHQGD